jgi:hypothetical protein
VQKRTLYVLSLTEYMQKLYRNYSEFSENILKILLTDTEFLRNIHIKNSLTDTEFVQNIHVNSSKKLIN